MFAETVAALIRQLVRVLYSIRVGGLEHIPARGPVLLVPNHVSYVDVILLQVACPRPIRFLADREIFERPWLKWFMRAFGVIPVSSARAKDALAAAVDALREGEVVCIFPEGSLTRSGVLMRLQRGYELVARRARAPVLPVWLDNLWNSIFALRGDRVFWKRPERVPYPVAIRFGKPFAPEDAHPAAVRRAMYDLGADAFADRDEFAAHLGRDAMRCLKERWGDSLMFDASSGREFTRGRMLVLGLALSDRLRALTDNPRIGIVLPPGAACFAVNLACLLAGRTAVNLNFTAGPAAVAAAIRKAGLTHIVTAGALVEKLADFPWTEHRIDIAEVIAGLSKPGLVFRGVLARVLPTGVLAALARVPEEGGRREAVLLFTSGSSGDPKGVVLTHANIIANVRQVESILPLGRDASVLGCLPIFHSFGATVTFSWPLLGGPRIIAWPSPTDAPKLAELIQQHRVSLMATTPTFLRGFLRKAQPEQLASLQMIVTGAEKLPDELRDEFEARFGVPVCQGYGMTEASPVVSTNVPDRPPLRPGLEPTIGRRAGSSGRLVPGISVRIRDPDTDADLEIFQTGMLWLRGANIIDGYLDDPARTAEALRDGWYRTGDLGRLDEDGFLFIEGRMSRFSKVGGEMVPHGTVESRIHAALGDSDDGTTWLVVTGIPDEAKGEALVLLTTREVDLPALRKKLLEAGTPALWIPKIVRVVERIPVLATGKLDLRACQEIAGG